MKREASADWLAEAVVPLAAKGAVFAMFCSGSGERSRPLAPSYLNFHLIILLATFRIRIFLCGT